MIYQIFSRIDKKTKENQEFQEVLQGLVYKICVDHPYHGIIQLISLSNRNAIGRGRNVNDYNRNVNKEKADVIKELLGKIRNSNFLDYIGDLVDSYQTLTDSYIALANMPTEKFTKGKRKIKGIKFADCFKEKSRALDSCLSFRKDKIRPCILTKPPTISPGADYGDKYTDPIGSERIVAFQPTFTLTENGIHRPKIVICIGSKGGIYKQLVKGEDDIRQDAVMQQVFTTVNFLLRNQSEKKSSPQNRNLRVVTYNCIPLSPENGK